MEKTRLFLKYIGNSILEITFEKNNIQISKMRLDRLILYF